MHSDNVRKIVDHVNLVRKGQGVASIDNREYQIAVQRKRRADEEARRREADAKRLDAIEARMDGIEANLDKIMEALGVKKS